jgi:hypothetical protein
MNLTDVPNELVAIASRIDDCLLCCDVISGEGYISVFTPNKENSELFLTPKGKQRHIFYRLCNDCFTEDCADLAEEKIVAKFKAQN